MSTTIIPRKAMINRECKSKITLEQDDIIKAPFKSNICINAAPGSGKTTTLIERIKYMTKHGIELSEICLFTYNRALADDMKKDIKKKGIDPNRMGFCGTLHSFCYRDTQSVDRLDKWINIYSNVKNPFQEYKYIIFDEYQDATKDIANVIDLLSKDKWLTITGDERQQIYGEMGANSTYLYSLKKFTSYPLTITFRCNTHMCKILTKLYTNYPPVKSHKSGNRPMILFSSSKTLNNIKVTDKIVELIKKHKNDSIAILSPIINTKSAARFINDIQSNIRIKCGITMPIIKEGVKGGNKVISSVHKSKGKEYDVVILLNTTFTHYTYDSGENSKCKLFVALSRARNNLYIFENIYGYNEYIGKGNCGTLPFITQNINLFDTEVGWEHKHVERGEVLDGSGSITVTDYIRLIDYRIKDDILSPYKEIEYVDKDDGLRQHYLDPTFSGQLIEILLAMKIFKEVPVIDISFFILKNHWDNLLNNAVLRNIFRNIEKIKGKEIKGIKFHTHIYYKSKDDKLIRLKKEYNLTQMLNNNICMDKIGYITIYDKNNRDIICIKGGNIVSNTIYNIYINEIDNALKVRNELTNEITPDNIQRIWWLLRFNRLSELSLVDFESPDINESYLERIINYINNEKLLSELNPFGYQIGVSGKFNHDGCGTNLTGIIDFESNDAIIEIKCFSFDSSIENTDDPSLQAILYNILSDKKCRKVKVNGKNKGNYIYDTDCNINSFKYKKIYIYNPMTGSLFVRELKEA